MITTRELKGNSAPGLTYKEALALADKNGEKVVPTFCAMCGPTVNACGIYAFTRNGRFLRVAGMRESPVNQGALCPKGHAAPQWVYSQDRLMHPLRRIGKKGEGRFEKTTWEDAIATIASTLKEQKEQYGPESLAFLAPAMRNYNAYMKRFLTVHGSPNYGHSGICALQKAFAFLYTLGRLPKSDIPGSDLIIYWGRQPAYTAPVMDGTRQLLAAKQRGAKIVFVKPSMPDVSMADIWLPVRPGTDAALALAMLNVVVDENLIDQAFVARWCYGYEPFKEHLRNYPPEWAEKITGIPAEQIIRVTRLYATTPRAVIDVGNGVEHAPAASDTVRAIASLMAVTGHLDRKGCNLLGTAPESTMPLPVDITLAERYSQELIDRLVGPEFPKEFQPFIEGPTSAYYRVLESVLTEKPYPVRAIIAPGTQPTVSTRGTKRVVEALKKLDFYVVADVTRTADMNYADIVIPVATPYEIDHPFGMAQGQLMARNRVIEPLADYRSTYQFILDLAVAMGYGEDFWDGNIEKAMSDQLKPFGMTHDELREHPTGVFYDFLPRSYENYEKAFTKKSPRLSRAPYLPQGKIALYNTTFEEAGFNPLPEWREPPESFSGTPELAEKYPLALSDYHSSSNYNASWGRNVPWLRELEPEPVIHIHPGAAAARGISHGDEVIVESPHGWMKIKAELCPAIRPDTVMMLHGWWQGCRELGFKSYPILDGGANTNNMYSVNLEKACDPLITAMSSQTMVQIKKA